MDSLVHALVMYHLDIKSITTVVVPTLCSVFKIELVKETVSGQEVIHLVFEVGIVMIWKLH